MSCPRTGNSGSTTIKESRPEYISRFLFFFSLLFFSFFLFFLFFFFPRSSSASTRVVSIPRSRVSPSFPAERSSRAIDSMGKDRFPGAFSLSLSLSLAPAAARSTRDHQRAEGNCLRDEFVRLPVFVACTSRK